MSPRPTPAQSLPRFIKLALTGCFAGGLVSIAGCHWLLWAHEDDLGFCDDAYDDCMANAVSQSDKQWCEDDVKSCYEACEAGWEDEDDGYGNDDDDGDDAADDNGTTGGDDGAEEPPPRSDDGGDGDGGEGETGEGETGVCIDLFSNCLDDAETLEDVEACEGLFDQCVNPGECPDCGGCPADALDACLTSYASCASLANTPEKIEACANAFDECTAPFAAECEVEENPNLEPCLDQHELCVACADDEMQLETCQTVFDSCLQG